MSTQLEDDLDAGVEDELGTSGTEVEGAEDDAEVTGAEDAEDEDDDASAGADDADEDVISFGGVDLRDEDEPEHIADLRRRYREEKRRREELEAAVAPKAEDAGPKPNLDDYWERDDPQGDFERDLLAWNAKRASAAERQEREREAAAALQREWEADLGELETQRSSLKVRDFEAAHDKVSEVLSEAQQAILVQVARNKAALLYALGKNTDRLANLAKVTNLAKFAGEVARLDMETRVSRKPATKPETPIRGAGSLSAKGATDAKLARLEAEAEKTGNRTAVIAYRRQMKAAGR